MIISLERDIFTIDPDERFSREHEVSIGFLNDMYRRYINYGYTFADLSDFYNIKTRKDIDRKTMWRWITRIEAYDIAQRAIRMGAKECNINTFGRARDTVLHGLEEEDVLLT